LSFFSRLWLAFVTWFDIVFDGDYAFLVAKVGEAPKELPAAPASSGDTSALRLLALLQREGRLVDFCEEELSGFPDAQVGAAARAVHAGCRKALREAFAPVAVRSEAEGAPVVLEAGFDPNAVRLTGNVAGNPPFRGTLRHHGWRASAVKLPTATGDATLLAPAEVELP
jgi:Domain of unknown function (DUF2760)